jgi:DNA polymerase-3 subunit delta'
MSFADPFLGNERIISQLEGKLAEDRLPHALIFTGPEGVGKRTCALRIAKTLQCQNHQSPACGTCAQCQKIEKGLHVDVMTLTLEADASQIKIERIRKLRSTLEFKPLEGTAKVYVIDPAERMTPGAANALLKALEEPPPATYFFLITANSRDLLATIRSRSQTYHFSPVPLAEIRNAGIVDERVVRWSQGSIGRAMETDIEELLSHREMVLTFLETVMTARDEALVDLISASADFARSKEDYRDRIRILGVLVSDLMFLEIGVDQRLVNVDIRERLERLQNTVSLDRIVQVGDCLRFIEANLKHYVNRQMMSDRLALTLNPSTAEFLHDKSWEYR